MATKAVGTLAVNLVARTRGFSKGLTAAQAKVQVFKAGMVAASAAVAKAVHSFEQFNRAMQGSLAIMGDVSEAMRTQMSAAAIDVARTTRFSAEDAAKSYFFLSSAGLDAAQSIEALPVVAEFAQAGMFDMALATDLATDAQSALGLTVKDAAQNVENLSRVTDFLVKGNTLANANVQQFSEALTNKAGAALRALGKDIEEGVAVLAAFADQGVKGAESGTQFSIVLRDLQTKAIQNAAAFRKQGIAVFDASGEMRHMSDIVGDVEQALKGLSDKAEKTLLLGLGFSDKSVSALQTLLGTSEKIAAFDEQLRASAGTRAEVASKQMTEMEKGLNKLAAVWTDFWSSKFIQTVTNATGKAFGVFGDFITGAKDMLVDFFVWAEEEGDKRLLVFGPFGLLGQYMFGIATGKQTFQGEIASRNRELDRQIAVMQAKQKAAGVFEPESFGNRTAAEKGEARRAKFAKLARDAEEKGFASLERNAIAFQSALEREAATFGMTARQTEIYTLAGQGLSNWRLKELKLLDQQLTKQEKLAKSQDRLIQSQKSLASQAKSLIDASRTPLENLRLQIEDIVNLYQVGALTLTQAQMFADQKLQAFASQNAQTSRNSAGAALLRGTSEAFSAQRATTKDTSIDKLRELVAQTKVQVKTEKDILAAIKAQAKKEPVQVASIPGGG